MRACLPLWYMHTHTNYLVRDYLLLPLRIYLYYIPNLSLNFIISSEACWFASLAPLNPALSDSRTGLAHPGLTRPMGEAISVISWAPSRSVLAHDLRATHEISLWQRLYHLNICSIDITLCHQLSNSGYHRLSYPNYRLNSAVLNWPQINYNRCQMTKSLSEYIMLYDEVLHRQVSKSVWERNLSIIHLG